MRKKKLLFNITRKDLTWQYYKGEGGGGQKKNKTENACRCSHKPSGAVGKAEDTRSKPKNRKLAFERMCATEDFESWVKLEADCRLGRVKIEYKDAKGNWVEKTLSSQLDP